MFLEENVFREGEIVKLYLRSPGMEVDEFETLLEAAARGEWPPHPDLPLFEPLPTESEYR